MADDHTDPHGRRSDLGAILERDSVKYTVLATFCALKSGSAGSMAPATASNSASSRSPAAASLDSAHTVLDSACGRRKANAAGLVT